jgi:hypothetical protein
MDGGGGIDGGPLSTATTTCIAGWWFSKSSPCPCTVQSPPPECAFSDCEFVEDWGFLEDGSAAIGQLTLSPSHEQFSRLVGSDDFTWAILDGGLVAIYGDGGALVSNPSAYAQCGADELLIGQAALNRQSPPLSPALQAAFEDGAWQAVQY